MNQLYRHITLTIFLLLVVGIYFGQQGIFIHGANIISPNGDAFYVNGDLQNDSTATEKGKFLNTGSIYLTGNIQNNTKDKLFWNDSSGVVIFNGSTQQYVNGDSVNFYSLELDNPSGLISYSSKLTLQDTFLLSNGTFNLNGNSLHISSAIGNGVVVGENSANYIYGSGFIKTIRDVNPGGNIAGIGLVLPPNNLGNTVVYRYHQSILNAGDGSISRYFSVEPNNIDTVNTEIDYLDHEINGLVESDLDIFHSADSTWWKRQFGTPNFASNWVNNAAVIYPNQQNWITVSEYYCDAPPAITFSADTIYRCGADSVLLQTNLSSSLEYKWSTGDIDSAIYATAAGNYIVEVWSPEGCYSIDSIRVIDKGVPDAAYSVPPGMICLGSEVELQYLDTVGVVPVAQYEWILGDLSNTTITTSVDSLLFTYGSGGNFSSELVVHSAFGCTDTAYKTILVDSLPFVDFGFADVCLGEVMNFNSLSQNQGLSGSIYSFAWDYGDGNSDTITITNTSNLYSSAGTYNVSLVVTENSGCKDSLTQSVVVHPNPLASFTANQVCEGTVTNFSNTSTGASSYQWSFESPNQSTAVNPSYTFSGNGTYNVELIAISTFGCDDTITSNVVVDMTPIVSISTIDTCELSTAFFTSIVSDTLPFTSYLWDFGDGNTSTSLQGSNVYSTPGNYSVSLSVTSGNSCIASATSPIVIYPKPSAGFSFVDACADSSVQFTNTSAIASGSIITYNWNFGDGNVSILQHPQHIFNANGGYNVQLIVETDQGCLDTNVQAININANPVVNLGGNLTTCGASLVLDAGNSGSNFNWNTLATTQTINATADGNYWVDVTSPFGCTGSDTASVMLNVASIPNLGADTIVCDSIMLDAYSPAATYTWSDLSTDSILWALSSGTYYVDRVDQNGCLGSDTIVVQVNNSPIVNLGVDQTFCEGGSTLLDAGNMGLNILWSSGDITSTIITDTTGYYTVTVTDPVTNCFGTDDIQVTVDPNPVMTLGADTTVCDSLLLSVGIYSSYLWSDGGITNANTLFSSGVSWLEVTNSYGCVTRDSIQVSVNTTPNLNLGPDQTLCQGNSSVLSAGVAANYLWSTGEISSNITVQNAGTYYVESNNANCFAYDTIQIAQDSIWQIDLGNDTGVCIGNVVLIEPNYLTGLSYQWFQDGVGFSNTPAISTGQSGIYTIEATNGNGCITYDTMVVDIYNMPVSADFLMPTNVYTGDTVNFISVTLDSNITYSWSFGDNIYSNLQNPQHTYFIPGSFDVSCSVSNGFCYDSITKVINVGVKNEVWFDFADQGNLAATIQDVVVFPNPANDILNLGILLSEERSVAISIFDVSGKMLYKNEQWLPVQSTVSFNIANVESGIYIVHLVSGLEKSTKYFIKN